MPILPDILEKRKGQFANSRKADERGTRFVYTIVAIIISFTGSKTSNIRRCPATLFGFGHIAKKRFYTFMASPKIPWQRLWPAPWNMIPEPLTQGRLLLALAGYINPKTGRKIFACAKTFDHAAKQNQAKYPRARNVVAVGLLKIIKGRRACPPPSWRFCHLKKNIEKINRAQNRVGIQFETKLDQAVSMIGRIATVFGHAPVLRWLPTRGSAITASTGRRTKVSARASA
jgi:hypothetical protein